MDKPDGREGRRGRWREREEWPKGGGTQERKPRRMDKKQEEKEKKKMMWEREKKRVKEKLVLHFLFVSPGVL